MAIVCPTVTPQSPDPHEFREQMDRVVFASRVQIDLMDGKFAPNKNLNPIQVWWPEGMSADIHLMYQQPHEHIETLISLKPHMIIVHAEADGNIEGFLVHIKKFGIKAGLAMLPDTSIESAHGCVEIADHVMLFSGRLGHFGGEADMSLLSRIPQIRSIKSDIEIGWDGGINESNARQLVEGGVDVLNVGGAIQNADDPEEAYKKIVQAARP